MNENKKAIAKEVISWIKTIIVAILVALFITNFIIINAKVPTGSMKNTIMPNDRLIANRLAYTFSEPQRGDIVVFPYPDDESKLFVKRIIGLPNEVVEIVDGNVYIDGELLEEDYVSSQITDSTVNSGPYVVPEGHVFMMGDNRGNSEDSRYWQNTYLDENKILGKVMFRYYPNFSLIK